MDINYYSSGPDTGIQQGVRRVENSRAISPSSQSWRVTPVMLSPHLADADDDSGDNGNIWSQYKHINLQLLRNFRIGSHNSILDTYISSPPC